MNNKEAIKLSKKLKIFCKQQVHCQDCCFSNNLDCSCLLKGTVPGNYNIKDFEQKISLFKEKIIVV